MTVERRWLYEPCPSLAGVVHEGCYYTAHFACTKCGWTNPGHHCVAHYGTLTPDTRLQAIADAWNSFLSVDEAGEEGMLAWSIVADLLGALTEDNDDELSAGTTPWPQWNTGALTEGNE